MKLTIPGCKMVQHNRKRKKSNMRYAELYHQGALILQEAGLGEAGLDARLLLEKVCGTNQNTLLCHGEMEVEEEQKEQFLHFIQKRALHVPLQHLTGEQEFMGLCFQVNPHVLIPRQDTEILVEEVLKDLHDGMRILDMCTGSGCILLSLLKYSNDCCGLGADISEEALQTARQNASRLGIQAEFIQSDLFEKVEGRFDVLVSNPPYIESRVIPTLMQEVRDYDPILALDGGEDGLAFYRRLIADAPEYLFRGGRLFLEIGCQQADAVSSMLQENGYTEINVYKDFAGLDRVVSATCIKIKEPQEKENV